MILTTGVGLIFSFIIINRFLIKILNSLLNLFQVFFLLGAALLNKLNFLTLEVHVLIAWLNLFGCLFGKFYTDWYAAVSEPINANIYVAIIFKFFLISISIWGELKFRCIANDLVTVILCWLHIAHAKEACQMILDRLKSRLASKIAILLNTAGQWA